MHAPIVFEEATKNYGSKVVGPVSLEVGWGEVFGIIGPNGSGKTTTIRLMLGLIRPSSGRVFVNGREPHRDRVGALQGVGYSPELPNLQTFLTPRELLELVGGELGLGRGLSEEVEEVLEKVGLLAYADTKIAKLSKGMVQRLSIAQALLGDPKILVLDEPLIGVDPVGADHIRRLLAGFAARGRTVVVSSHMLSEVEAICTSVAAFRNGRVVFSGRVGELVERVLGELTVRVRAEGLDKFVVEEIGSLEGVLGVEERADGLYVRVKAGVDVRPKIARRLVEHGCGLKEICYTSNPLSEVYRRLVAGDGRLEG